MAFMNWHTPIEALQERQEITFDRLVRLEDTSPTGALDRLATIEQFRDAALPKLVALEQFQSTALPKLTKLDNDLTQMQAKISSLEENNLQYQTLPPRLKKLEDLQLDSRLKHLETLHTELSSTAIPILSQLRRNTSETDGKIAELEKTVEILKDRVDTSPRPNGNQGEWMNMPEYKPPPHHQHL